MLLLSNIPRLSCSACSCPHHDILLAISLSLSPVVLLTELSHPDVLCREVYLTLALKLWSSK